MARAAAAAAFPPARSIANHLRVIATSAAAAVDAALIEQALQVATSDAHLDMLMPSIDKAAAEKGIREVDEELAPAFAMRKSSREKTGRPYYDTSVMQATRYGHAPVGMPRARWRDAHPSCPRSPSWPGALPT